MTPPFQIVRMSDEGSSSEFTARLVYGILRLRDDAVRHMCPSPEEDFEMKRNVFDKAYEPVLAGMRAIRAAAKELVQLVTGHVQQVDNGTIVHFQRNAFQIADGIDLRLQELAARVLVQGVIALKAVQSVTGFFGLDIGSVFQTAANFEHGMLNLRSSGHEALEIYLRSARASWMERFIKQRADVEHKGWVLPRVDYLLVAPTRVRASIPSVCELAVDLFARLSARRLQAFVENTVAYAISQIGRASCRERV